MARWYATDVAGDAFGPVFQAPDKVAALAYARGINPGKTFGVVSYLEWQEIVAQRQAEARKKGRLDDA